MGMASATNKTTPRITPNVRANESKRTCSVCRVQPNLAEGQGLHTHSRGSSDEITPKGLHLRNRGSSVATPPDQGVSLVSAEGTAHTCLVRGEYGLYLRHKYGAVPHTGGVAFGSTPGYACYVPSGQSLAPSTTHNTPSGLALATSKLTTPGLRRGSAALGNPSKLDCSRLHERSGLVFRASTHD